MENSFYLVKDYEDKEWAVEEAEKILEKLKSKKKEYYLNWWGASKEAVKEKYNLIPPMYFNTNEEYTEVIDKLSEKEFKTKGIMISSKVDSELIHAFPRVYVTCEYLGKEYKYQYDFEPEYLPENVEYMFMDGNYACPCNHSNFIQNAGYKDFPELECTDEDLVVKEILVEYIKI